MTERAFTYVDRGQAKVGNRWVERTWSTFVGHTTGLARMPEEIEWTAGLCREFSLLVDGEPLGVMDFGEVEWSEENGPAGATLVARKMRPGFEVDIRTLALHDSPALVRTVTLRNTGRNDVAVSRVVVDSLGLTQEGVRVYTQGFATHHDAIEWRTDERAAALVRDREVLFVGSEAPCTFRLHAPDAGVCAVAHEAPQPLAAGATLLFPSTYLLATSGDLAECARTTFTDFLVRLRALRRAAPSTH